MWWKQSGIVWGLIFMGMCNLVRVRFLMKSRERISVWSDKVNVQSKSQEISTHFKSLWRPSCSLCKALLSHSKAAPKRSGFILITYGFQSDWCSSVSILHGDVSSRGFLLILHLITQRKRINFDNFGVFLPLWSVNTAAVCLRPHLNIILWEGKRLKLSNHDTLQDYEVET